MKGVRLLLGVLGTTVALVGTSKAQGIDLPAGPNREMVFRECQACHDLSMVVGAAGLTRDGWTGVIEEMTSYGMSVTVEERMKILDYLSGQLGPSADPSQAAR